METVTSSATGSRTKALEQRISAVGHALYETLTRVVDAVPGAPRRPMDLARTLRINKDLSSRLLTAFERKDTLAVVHFSPGPEPLRLLLRAAARHGVNGELIDEAERAVDAFDHLIRHEGGDRAGLNAIIGAWLPDARQRFEGAAKQAAFKATAYLKGVQQDISLTTLIVHPSADPAQPRCDGVLLCGLFGLRRLRPNAVIQITDVTHHATRSPIERDHESVTAFGGPLLQPFCSHPVPPVETLRRGDRVHYLLGDNGVGPKSAADLVLVEVYHGILARYRPPQGPKTSFAYANVEQPAKLLYFDMVLHEDVWPGCQPQLRVYDTTTNGVADARDPGRDVDLLDLAESIQNLGAGLTESRISEIPKYVDLIRFACERMGWDSAKFRTYRCRIQYPFYGSQVCMIFDPPEQPSA